ncbi:MAG: hypothetical protein ACE3JQ_03010 [Paenisporosarcina sp.]
MSSEHVDPKEMELRVNRDYIASQNMVDEGAPVYEIEKEEKKKEDDIQ